MLFEAGVTDVKVFAVCASVLYAKFLATTMVQGRIAFKAGTRLAEDRKLPMAPGQMPDDKVVKAAAEAEQRWKRIIQNDLESMPMAFVVFWGAIAAKTNPAVTSGLLVAYTAARLSHTLTFAKGMPRARMLSWMGGSLCILAAGVSAVVSVFSL
jgi:glutathione S-transferase